jgi:hypothetical protein
MDASGAARLQSVEDPAADAAGRAGGPVRRPPGAPIMSLATVSYESNRNTELAP